MIFSMSIFLLVGGIFVSTTQAQQLNRDDVFQQSTFDVFGMPLESSSTVSPIVQKSNQFKGNGVPGTSSCTCVPYYLCREEGVNKNGEGVIDTRVQNAVCENFLDVCCDNEIQVDRLTTIKQSKCGKRRLGLERISGGPENETLFGEYPWMVAVLKEEKFPKTNLKLDIYQCGGALIHPQMVVTAAHCVRDTSRTFKIRAGEWDSGNTNELYAHQDREVQTITIHPKYYFSNSHNDIALLYLKSPVEIKDHVDTICLPPQGMVPDSTSCLATGWGKNEFGKNGTTPKVLKSIDLPIVLNDKCQEQLRTTRLGRFFQLNKSFICAGGEAGKDTCRGDGGSPLVCLIAGEKDKYFQAGIVAWGIGCGENNIPGVYVNVPLFREWIDTQMKSFGLDSSTYEY